MTDPHDLDGQRGAYRPEFRFFHENRRTLDWYAGRVVELARRCRALSVLSLGVGQRIVCRRLLEMLQARLLERYLIVEASTAAIAELTADWGAPAGLEIREAWFEGFSSAERFDVVEMGFVLEHVDDPAAILARYRELLAPGGCIAIAVPNARSLHRLIGHAAGLLDDLFRLSPADRELGHQRYFDRELLRRLLAEAGLEVEAEAGIFLKPLTTEQLERLALPEAVWQGLFEVGAGLPDLANALYVEARRR